MMSPARDQSSGPEASGSDKSLPDDSPELLGPRVRALRAKQKLSLADLARLSGVSKGYLSQVERSLTVRPSAAVIFAIAEALGTTVGALFEGASPAGSHRRAAEPVPASLRDFALEAGLPPADIEMLAQIRYRGSQPRDKDDWRFIYESIRRSIRHGRRSAIR
jgi:transcriptional regulator with XRE-family HTH domain